MLEDVLGDGDAEVRLLRVADDLPSDEAQSY